MRRSLELISAVGLAMALATSAQAAQFTGNVSYGLSTLPALVASGSGSGTSTVSQTTLGRVSSGRAEAECA